MTKKQPDILGFHDTEGTKWLSNFYPCDCPYLDINFKSTEAAFQAAKHKNISRAKRISRMTPYDAMVEGRRGKPRKDWTTTAVAVMHTLLYIKFSHVNPYLLKRLLDTRDCRIAETNTWGDLYWGEDENGNGLNILGRLLMNVREQRRMETLLRKPSTKAHHKK